MAIPAPTDGEMAILRGLWSRGPSTARQVHEALHGKQKVGYTTSLKMPQIIREKGIVSRQDGRRPHIYRPSQEPAVVQDGLVSALIRKAFGDSATSLVMRALSTPSPPWRPWSTTARTPYSRGPSRTWFGSTSAQTAAARAADASFAPGTVQPGTATLQGPGSASADSARPAAARPP